MKSFLRRILGLFFPIFKKPEQYAREIGVNIGSHCLISTRHWSSEPYLISIGNHVQITADVRFQTHGGGMPCVINIQILIYLGK